MYIYMYISNCRSNFISFASSSLSFSYIALLIETVMIIVKGSWFTYSWMATHSTSLFYFLLEFRQQKKKEKKFLCFFKRLRDLKKISNNG